MNHRLLYLATTLFLSFAAAHAIEPTERNIIFGKLDERQLSLDLYLPDTHSNSLRPTIIWVHGGAWRAGTKEDVPVTLWLDQGFAIASVGYRLSTEAIFPAQIHDIKAAIRFMRANASKWSLNPNEFVIAGSSAGGHLAALAGLSGNVESLEGRVGEYPEISSQVQAIVSFYGASNLQTILAQSTPHGLSVRIPALQLLLGGQPNDKSTLAKLASPVTHVDPEDPPLWLIHGDADPQMPVEQSNELAAQYKKYQLPIDYDVVVGGKHGGTEFFKPERLDRIAKQIKQFFDQDRTQGKQNAALQSDETRSSSSNQSATAIQRPVRILFAGSSSTYWNDMPNEIAQVVSMQGGVIRYRPVTAEIVGRSGSDIRVYLDPNCDYQYGVKPGQTFLDKVKDEKFDYVVLMVVCRFITGDGEDNQDGKAHVEAVTRYCQAIRASGAEPVFYEMGWGSTEREAEGRRRIFELAKQNQIKNYAPCSSVWEKIRAERSDIALQHPSDNSHPGDLGHFANLATFYAAMTHASPEGKLPREFHVWPHLNKEEKELKRDDLERAYAKFIPNEYQRKLPEWMRRNAGAGYVARISENDARYIERTAWEIWQNVNAKLQAK